MGLFDKFKKGMELKQSSRNPDLIQKTNDKISRLEKKLCTSPENTHLLIDLYMCYVEISNTEKKIECMKKLSILKPHDSYPLQQLADIYSDMDNMEKAQYYQNKANKIGKFL